MLVLWDGVGNMLVLWDGVGNMLVSKGEGDGEGTADVGVTSPHPLSRTIASRISNSSFDLENGFLTVVQTSLWSLIRHTGISHPRPMTGHSGSLHAFLADVSSDCKEPQVWVHRRCCFWKRLHHRIPTRV